MYKLFYLWLFIALLGAQIAVAENSPARTYVHANQAYSSENFQQAAELYREILSRGYESADVYYNLGNCYYRMGQTGNAILYYLKAKKLNPRDPDLNYNLELANLKVIDRIEMPPRFFLFEWWDAVKYFYSVQQISVLLIVLLSVAVLLLILWLFVKRNRLRKVCLSAAVVFGLLFLFWLNIYFSQVAELRDESRAVILQPTVTVMSAPDESSTDVFVLHEGVVVTVEDQRGAWIKITLPDGKSGWLKKEILGIV